MTIIDDSIWKSESVVDHYMDRKDSRPFIREQMEVMLRLIETSAPGSAVLWIWAAVMACSRP